MDNVKVEETTIENVSNEIVIEEKPYKLKENLEFDDLFPVMTLIDKIGIDKFEVLADNKIIMDLLQGKTPTKIDEEGNEIPDNDAYMQKMMKVMVVVVKIIVSSLGKCKKELYEVLSSVSNLSVEEIGKLKFKYVSSMIMDLIKKEDFQDFFKGLSLF